MSHRIPGLSALPRLAIGPPRTGVKRLRAPHAPWAVSTIEAGALALEAVGEAAACDALHKVQDLFWTRMKAQAGAIRDPRRFG
jgi:DTW domain-containing protein YfiP